MAFDNIYDFVFYDLLKYDPSSSVLTGELQNDVIFGLLIPTIFIAIVAHQGVHRIFGDSSKFVAYLSSLTSVGVVVTLGWVPIIAGIGGFVFVGLLGLYFMYAFYRRIVSEGHEKAAYDIAGKVGDKIRDKIDITDPTISGKELGLKKAKLTEIDRRYAQYCSILNSLKTGLRQPRTSINTGGGVNPGGTTTNNSGEARDLEDAKGKEVENAVEIVMSIPHSMRGDVINRCVKNGELKRILEQLKKA